MSETPRSALIQSDTPKKKLLLHVCCAPDATHALETLRPEYDVVGFFFNPNIYPESEYYKRLDAWLRLVKLVDLPYRKADYAPDGWEAAVRGLESEPEGGKRCAVCFRYNLLATAERGRMEGFDLFATTLTISPHKNVELINAVGREVSKDCGIDYSESNFRKREGFKRSVELSRKYGLYRQKYCGCRFSMRQE